MTGRRLTPPPMQPTSERHVQAAITTASLRVLCWGEKSMYAQNMRDEPFGSRAYD